MIYGSLKAAFMDTKHNGHIHRYGTPIFGTISVYVSKPINNDNQIHWRIKNIVRFDMPNIDWHRKQDFRNISCIPCIINLRMDYV